MLWFFIYFLRTSLNVTDPASRANASSSRPDTILLSLELILLDGEGHLKQLLLLLGVCRLETGSNGRAWATAGVHDVLPVVVRGLVQQGLNSGLGEAPGAGIERFLLAPDDGLGVGVLVEILPQLLPREGVQLLDARNGDVVDVVLGAVLVQRGVHLAGTENDAVNLLVGLDGAGLVGGIRDDPVELGITRELLDVGAGDGVTQERLREEDDESYC